MIKISLPTQTAMRTLRIAYRYLNMLLFISYSLSIGLIIYYTGVYSKIEPTTSQVEDKKKTITSKKVDNDSITRLRELESRNISLESLFDNGRNNPFEN
jgi:hypothetical protein